MKQKLFYFAMLLISVLLFLLRLTGIGVHIALSVVGVLLLVVYAIKCRKEWHLPAAEIALRILFAVAFISGIVLMTPAYSSALSIVHKISAAASTVLLLVLYVPTLIKKENA